MRGRAPLPRRTTTAARPPPTLAWQLGAECATARPGRCAQAPALNPSLRRLQQQSQVTEQQIDRQGCAVIMPLHAHLSTPGWPAFS
jgi:hypothetical protein